MSRAVKYISEFLRIVEKMDVEFYVDTVGGLMRIFFKTKYGETTLLLKLYTHSIHARLIYPKKVPVLCRPKVTERLTELNNWLDRDMTYMIDDRNELSFVAQYELTKSEPAYDDRLGGFCELLFMTVPSKLNDVVDTIIAPVHISNDNTGL